LTSAETDRLERLSKKKKRMEVLKEHRVGPTDKVSVGKVEALLNSMLKELQKEKSRSRVTEETVRKLQGSTQQQVAQPTAAAAIAQLATLQAEVKQVQQQQQFADEAVAKRLSALEVALSAAAVANSSVLPPPADEPRRNATNGQKVLAHAPPPRHREPPMPAAAAVATATVASPSASVLSTTAPSLDHLEARLTSLECRTASATVAAASAASSADGSAAAVFGLRARLDEVSAAKGGATDVRAALEGLDARVEAAAQACVASHAKPLEENCRLAIAAANEAAAAAKAASGGADFGSGGADFGSGGTSAVAGRLERPDGRHEAEARRHEARLHEVHESVRAVESAQKALEAAVKDGARQREEDIIRRLLEEKQAGSSSSKAERQALESVAKEAAAARSEAAKAKVEAAAAVARIEVVEARMAAMEREHAVATQAAATQAAADKEASRKEAKEVSLSTKLAEIQAEMGGMARRVEGLEHATARVKQEAVTAAVEARAADARVHEVAAGYQAARANDVAEQLSRRCATLEKEVATLRLSVVGHSVADSCALSGGDGRVGGGRNGADGVDATQLDAALRAKLEAKLDRTEWASLRDSLLATVQKLLAQHLSQQRPPPPLPTAQQQAPGRHATPPQAWAGTDAAASAAEAESARMRLESRTVNESFSLIGGDGRLYKGASSGLVQEWVLEEPHGRMVPPTTLRTSHGGNAHSGAALPLSRPGSAGASSTPARPSSAGPHAAASRAERPGSAGSRGWRPPLATTHHGRR